MFELTMVTMIATAVIAYAAVQTWLVYERMSGQITEQTRLTREMFLESHKPMLSVSITHCVYSEGEQWFKGRITIKNHGTALANAIDLTMSFGGTNFIKRIERIAIQPKSSIPFILSLRMGPDQYRKGQTPAEPLNLQVQGSYKGLSGQTYSYNEKQHYEPELKRFFPIVVW